MSYLLAFLGFAALIILHEAGHFSAAKLVGMRVERFSLFFGPLLWKVRRGETEYGIGPIPLGGYVRISGMNPAEELPPEVVPRAYYNQPPWKRIVVILAGPFVNLLIAFLILFGIYWSQGELVPSHTVAGPLERPASQYLKVGDEIVAVDGKSSPSVEQIARAISSHICAGAQTAGCQAATPVTLTVKRDGQVHVYSIYPRYDKAEKRSRIGFTFGTTTQPIGPATAGRASGSEMWYVTKLTVTTLARIFEPQDRKQIHGIVGGFTVTQERFAFSTTKALFTLALISLSLAVVNLFPFLPLDGGHVFWAVAEKVRGRRIPFAVMERSGAVGFVLIILIFAIGLSNDITTLTGNGFNVR